MIELLINNSLSSLAGLTSPQYKSLRKVLSYSLPPETRYFSGGFNTRKYLIDKKGTFPTGLLNRALSWIAVSNIDPDNIHIVDKRCKPSRLNDFPYLDVTLKPYPEQLAAAEACYKTPRGIIVAPTGFGKSMIAALIINKLKVPTLIVVPTLEIKRQLSATLMTYFTNLLSTTLNESLIAVENVDALDPNEPLEGYDCVIIDEFHHSAATTYQKLNRKSWSNVFHRYGLTATPFRTKNEENMLLEAVLSTCIYAVSFRDAVVRGYIVPIQAYYIEVPRTKPIGTTWTQVYSLLVVKNETRNSIIADHMALIDSYGKSSLCLVKEIAHGEALSALTETAFANGENEITPQLIESFNKNNITQLIGTTGILGEGIDTKPAEFVIIAGLGKSRTQFMQQVGRGLRKYPGKQTCKVIIFLDRSHKWTIAHFKEQCKILLEEYGVVPTQIRSMSHESSKPSP